MNRIPAFSDPALLSCRLRHHRNNEGHRCGKGSNDRAAEYRPGHDTAGGAGSRHPRAVNQHSAGRKRLC